MNLGQHFFKSPLVQWVHSGPPRRKLRCKQTVYWARSEHCSYRPPGWPLSTNSHPPTLKREVFKSDQLSKCSLNKFRFHLEKSKKKGFQAASSTETEYLKLGHDVDELSTKTTDHGSPHRVNSNLSPVLQKLQSKRWRHKQLLHLSFLSSFFLTIVSFCLFSVNINHQSSFCQRRLWTPPPMAVVIHVYGHHSYRCLCSSPDWLTMGNLVSIFHPWSVWTDPHRPLTLSCPFPFC